MIQSWRMESLERWRAVGHCQYWSHLGEKGGLPWGVVRFVCAVHKPRTSAVSGLRYYTEKRNDGGGRWRLL